MYIEIKKITLATDALYISSNYPSNGFYRVHQKLKKGEDRKMFPDMLILVTGLGTVNGMVTMVNIWENVESVLKKSQPEPQPESVSDILKSIPEYNNFVDTSDFTKKPTEVKFEGVSEDFALNMLSIALHNNKTK